MPSPIKKAHQHRALDRRGRRGAGSTRSAGAPFEPPPAGYFLELVRRYNWPPGFSPQPIDRHGIVSREMSGVASAARELAKQAGMTWAVGTVSGGVAHAPRAAGKR